jgi:allantoinase
VSAFDVLVRGGTVVTPAGLMAADVGIRDGTIAAIEPELAGDAGRTLDARGLHVLPGAVDVHVHFNDPGRTDWEGFPSGTAAAAAGGTTTVVDMPLNSHPPTVDAQAFEAKLAVARQASSTDFALWGGLVPGGVGRMAELAGRGVVGFKAFMSNSGIDDFEAVDDLTLHEGMQEAARLGLPVAVHAESDVITAGLSARARAQGRTAMRDYLRSRPAIAELQAIARALVLAADAGCALHVVHVSTGRGVALVAEARARGQDVTCETCPHYLALDEDDAVRLGAVAKCAPPLRPREECEGLWQALSHGDIDLVASDHSPSPPELKDRADAFEAWGGIAGAQTLAELVLGDGTGRSLPLALLSRVLATAPAERFSLPKGRVELGADADLMLVDLGARRTLQRDELRSRHALSPFVGRELHARVATVLLRGRPPQPGAGRLVIPQPRSTP